MKKRHFKNSTPLHEANYAKLMLLAPNLKAWPLKSKLLTTLHNHQIEMRIAETTPYTTAIVIKICQQTLSLWLPHIEMTLRSYHDAGVTEVIKFQKHRNIRSSYDYPNNFMYQVNEKQQLNYFLSECLDHWLSSRHIFKNSFESIDV